MTKVSSTAVMEQVRTKSVTPQWLLPDADSTAEITLTQALEFCAQKMKLAGPQAVVGSIQQGDRNACKYCHYSIAKQVAESLGALDENVKAVYVADYDATPEDLCFGTGTRTSPIHMIVWAERKTNALEALAEALDRAMAKRYANIVGPRQLTHLLDVQVVDDYDVENHIGYGAMLSSLYNRPIQIWER